MSKRVELYSGAAPAGALLVDFPWPFKDKLPGNGRGAAKHYNCLSIEALKAFPVPPLLPDCWGFFWRTGAHAREAFEILDAWGFTYTGGEIVWEKTTNDGSRIRIGMGRTVRNCHEVCMIAKRGRPERLSKSIPSVFRAPRTRHSAKPSAIHELIERFAPGPYTELFAREQRPGWQCFGDQCPTVETQSIAV